MDYCGPRGLPLAEFLKWDADDQEHALAWLRRDRSRCPSCGVPHGDWDEDAGGDRNAYHAEGFICRGCEELENAKSKEPHAGERWRLVPSWWLRMWGGRE